MALCMPSRAVGTSAWSERVPVASPGLRSVFSVSSRRAAGRGAGRTSAKTRRAGRAALAVRASSNGFAVGENPEHNDSDFLALGLAQCYVKDEDNKLQEVLVIEPIPAAALECLDNGGVTSYRFVTGSDLGTALKEDASLLPSEFAGGRFCDEFEFRAKCCVRTWKRPHAQENLLSLVPRGAVRSDFNFSVEDKRVLNMENNVTDDDNIKQDLSIDVYGRAGDEASAPGEEAEIAKLYNA